MTTSAVIPIKQLQNAKQRLAAVLNAEQRNTLFQMMVEDVLTAVEACVLVDEIFIVTDDPTVSRLGLGYGAQIRREPQDPGLIAAVTQTATYLAGEGVEVMLFLPGDVPLVSPDELEIVLDGFGKQGKKELLIVPANDLGGSNCIACAPPDCMEFAFGEDSFRRHLAIARRLAIEPTVAKLPGIGLDVDTPDDLHNLAATLVESGLDSNTYRYLKNSGILDKMSEGLLRIG